MSEGTVYNNPTLARELAAKIRQFDRHILTQEQQLSDGIVRLGATFQDEGFIPFKASFTRMHRVFEQSHPVIQAYAAYLDKTADLLSGAVKG